jgi:hypothetical protein
MKKSFRRFFFIPVFLLLIISQQLYAQQISMKEAMFLVKQNSSFLNLSSEDIDNSIISDAYFDRISNTQLIYLQQSYQGIPVYHAIQVIALKKDHAISVEGQRIAKIEEKVTGVKEVPAVSATQSVSAAARELKIQQPVSLVMLRADSKNLKVEFSSAISKENITSDLMWVQGNDGKVRMAWQVKIVPHNSDAYWLVRINANDESVLGKDNLTLSDNWNRPVNSNEKVATDRSLQPPSVKPTVSPKTIQSSDYRIIPFPAEAMSFPGGTPTLVSNPWVSSGVSNNAISLGWHNDGNADYAYTRGNNVWAKEDHLGNNSNSGAVATSTSATPYLTFDFPFHADQQPDTGTNLNFAITQLFYWNNVMHDVSYQYGFDEASGNFQNDNLSRGGLGNDFVYADAQDGSGTDNANFSTPADGSNPRMQMFLWSPDQSKNLNINSPSSIAGPMPSLEGAVSNNNLFINVGPVTGDLVLYNDDVSGTTHLACGSAANAGALSGKIAVIDRASCNFTVKIKNAQTAGAIAVIMVNNVGGDSIIVMGGSDNTITIPAVMISQNNGSTIKSLLAANTVVNATLSANGIQLDGDLDNGIMAHEYTHGISTRLTGGPSAATCLTNNEQGGEGWSDYMALMMTTNWSTASISDGTKARSLGTYVIAEQPTDGGIRTYPYSTDLSIDPWTYADMAATGGEVHTIGEIWAATLWDMTWNIIQQDGINSNLYNANGTGGNSVALKLVMLGLKLQPCQPGFLDARDAILKADTILYDGTYSCAIWKAFARRGMGILAQQGSSNNTTDQVADFSIPASAIIYKTVDKSEAAQNDFLTYTLTVKAQCANVSNYKIVDTLLPQVTYVSGGTYNAADRTVTFDVSNLSASTAQSFSFRVRINVNSYFAPQNLLNEPVSSNSIPSTLTANSTSPSIKWSTSTTNHSASYSLKASDPSSAVEQTLTSQSSYAINGNTQLSFWQDYNTEASHDGAVVELSTDNGTTWFDAGPYMSQNGYNSTINTNSNLTDKRAFSGSSNGFIQTIVNLSSFEGRSVKFRFRFVTDDTKSGTGWYIDDISIDETPAVYNLGELMDNSNVLKSISDTVTSITSQVLALAWGSFSAEKIGNAALLKWSTLQEINTARFVIERSKDGIHFNQIGQLTASGNTSGVTFYNLSDVAPLSGNDYYRISEIDRDGKILYSEVKMVSFDFAPATVIISPNPAKDHLNISVAGNKEALHLALVNSVGQVVSTTIMKDEYNSIPVHAIPSGVYYLKITGGNISTVRKVVIEK